MKMHMDGLGATASGNRAAAYRKAQLAILARTQAAKAAAVAATAAAEDAAAPGVAVAYLTQQVAAGKPLTGAQLDQVGIALSVLPESRIVDLINKQDYLNPSAAQSHVAGLAGWFTSIRDSIESVAASPITIFAPNSILAKTVSQGAQAKAITMVRLRDATEAVASVVANYWVPGISVVLSKYVVSAGAREKLNSNVGKVVQLATSAAGVYNLATSPAVQGELTSAKDFVASKIPTVSSMVTGAESAAYTKATQLIESALTPAKPGGLTPPSLSVATAAPAAKTSIMPLILGAVSLLTLLS